MAAPPLDEPLLFERIFLEKVWGGRALERALGIVLPEGCRIGETWEISDRKEHDSVVARGRFRGHTLSGLMAAHRGEILGRARASPDGGFPLLVKFLDATQNLSVQVHPHRAIAHTLRAGDSPKTECWYIVAAEPDGGIWHGLRPGVDPERLAAEVSGPGIVPLLSWYHAEPGQFFFVPGGTVHSIGAGVTLVEIQEPSDTTYRLYDWGRTGLDGSPRELSIERGLRAVRQVKSLQKPRRPYRRGIAHKDDENRRARCIDSDEFAVDLLELRQPIDRDTQNVAVVYVAIEGQGRLRAGNGEACPVVRGDAWLVPATLGLHRIEPEGTLRVLQVTTKT